MRWFWPLIPHCSHVSYPSGSRAARADLYLTLHRSPRDGRGKEASNEDRMNYDFCGMCAVDKGKITWSTKTVVVGLSPGSTCLPTIMHICHASWKDHALFAIMQLGYKESNFSKRVILKHQPPPTFLQIRL